MKIYKIIREVIANPAIVLDSKQGEDKALENTKVIKLIAEQFNITHIPEVDVLGITNQKQQLQVVEKVVSDNFIPERALTGINVEDMQSKKIEGAVKLIENIHKVIEEEGKDGNQYILKNLEQITRLGLIGLTEEFRTAYSKLKAKTTPGYDELKRVISQLEKDVNNTNLTNGQKESITGKLSSVNELINNIQQTKAKDQKIGAILGNQQLTVEEKVEELIKLKLPEKVLTYIVNNPRNTETNRAVAIGYIAKEKDFSNINKFVAISEQLIVSMKLTDKEKRGFVGSIRNSIVGMTTKDSETVIEKTLVLLDSLIATGELDQDIFKGIIPELISAIKKEPGQKQAKIISGIIKRLEKTGQEGGVSQAVLQNFPDLRRRLTNITQSIKSSNENSAVASLPEKQATTLRAAGTDLLISSLPVEVLAKDFREEAVRSVLSQVAKSPKLVENEKVSEYMSEYVTEYLKTSFWSQESFQVFTANINSFMGLDTDKGETMINQIIKDFIGGNNDPQEKFVAVLKVLALYEANVMQNTKEARELLAKFSESYDRAIEYLIISLPTLGDSVVQAMGYLSKQTRDKLREKVESSLKSGGQVLKRGNELILNGLNEAEGRKA